MIRTGSPTISCTGGIHLSFQLRPCGPDCDWPAGPDRVGDPASNLIGKKVYNGTAKSADNVGSVDDLFIGENGAVDSVIVSVGGFLGSWRQGCCDYLRHDQRAARRTMIVGSSSMPRPMSRQGETEL